MERFGAPKEVPRNTQPEQLEDFEVAELSEDQRIDLREALDSVGAQLSQKKS